MSVLTPDDELMTQLKRIQFINPGSSNSLIGNGFYRGENIYIKIFTNSKSQGLLYEKKVYEKLKETITENIMDFFVMPLYTFELGFKTTSSTFNSKIEKLKKAKLLDNINTIYGIITLNHSGTTLDEIIISLLNTLTPESIYFFLIYYI